MPASQAAKIYHLHPLVAGPLPDWPSQFTRIAGMGFDAVCVAPPFAPGREGDIFVTSDHEKLHPLLGWNGSADAGLAWAAEQAAATGLQLILDLVLDRVAGEAELCHRHADWFSLAGGDALPDPRRPPQRPGQAYARFDRAQAADGLAEWWIERLARLSHAGVAGFRCLTPHRVPAAIWRRITQDVRSANGGCDFIGWIGGAPRPAAAALESAGFDRIGATLAPWDMRSAWLVQEIEALRHIAPVLTAPEAGFSDRLAPLLSPFDDLPTAYRRALRVAAVAGAGVFVPMGFEFATRRGFDAARAAPADLVAAEAEAPVDLRDTVAEANALVDEVAALGLGGTQRMLTVDADPSTAWLRADAPDIRQAETAALVLVNPDSVRPAPLPMPLTPLPPQAGSAWLPAAALDGAAAPLSPGEVRLVRYRRAPAVRRPDRANRVDPNAVAATRIGVEAVAPAVPGGDFPPKAVVGQSITVSADIIADGHDRLAAELRWRAADENEWQTVRMLPGNNDRWSGSFVPMRNGRHEFVVEAWWDQFESFRHDLTAKHTAGQPVGLEVQEGAALLRAAAERSGGETQAVLQQTLTRLAGADAEMAVALLQSLAVAEAMEAADDRPFAARSAPMPLWVDRPQGLFASWYELFPRSETDDPSRHGTLRDVIRRLPMIRDMGFDVLYFPPIHPIGTVNRKGRNNALRAQPNDVGSPYAIGSAAGGHDALHPDLGTLDDFRALVAAARQNGLELALDFAVQCAPDHPWLTEHPDWFRWRPDGSLRYAENPPKKYEDIVNPDFYAPAAMPALWLALRDAVEFWVEQGVRIFRVDNPHTKPLPFWRWLIADLQTRHPDLLFLSEAFTRPKLMYRLAKIGFSQSYTYFTWRNSKWELTEYLKELTSPPVSDFFRPNFFVNTPDIDPVFLQTSGRPGFLIRAALATTLSGLWGMYSGFEICEAAPLPGREEYLDSEKYEIRVRDWDAPGNIRAEIATLNRIRRAHPALQSHLGLTFQTIWNDQILLYSKQAPNGREVILVAVSLDPHQAQEGSMEIPLWQLGLPDDGAVEVTDLMRGYRFTWYGKHQHLRLDPADLPFAIWRLMLPGGVA